MATRRKFPTPPALLLAGALAACTDVAPTGAPRPVALPPADAALLSTLEAERYEGAVMILNAVAHDAEGTRASERVMALEEGRTAPLAARSAPSGGRLSVSAAAEIGNPDQIDSGNNTPTSQIRQGFHASPSIVACGRRSRLTFVSHFYVTSNGQTVTIQEADILSMQMRIRANAGGHYHSGTTESQARIGTLSPRSGHMTGGEWNYQWDLPEAAQEWKLTVTARFENPFRPGTIVQATFALDDVFASRYTGLVRVPDGGQDYDRVGGTATHPEHLNDWGTSALVSRMQRAARLYREATGDRTRVNDMSLPYGGRFDLGGAWGGSHREHRFAEVDTRPYNWTERGRQRFNVALQAAGLTAIVESDHFHARAPGSAFPCR